MRDWDHLNDDNRRSLQRVAELDEEADFGSTRCLIVFSIVITIDDALSIDGASANFPDNDG